MIQYTISIFMNNIPLTIFLALTLAWTPANALEIRADTLGRTVLEKSGIRVGVCEMPRVGDGRWQRPWRGGCAGALAADAKRRTQPANQPVSAGVWVRRS